jgi:hypothetical protein
MSITLYGTEELIFVQQRLADLPDGFWRSKFARVVTSDKEEIMFERADIDNRRLAPFVAPNVQGRVMRRQGYYARSFKPAYVKPKHEVNPSMAIPRMMGEPLMGNLSLAQRQDAIVVETLRQQRIMIERRWDWMASKACIDGSVVVAGDDYPTVTVDFGRDSSLTTTLLTTARWDQLSTADPLADISDMCDIAFEKGNAPITDIVFGSNAWKNFVKNADVIALLSTQRRGGGSDFSTVPIVQSNYQSMGFIDGGSNTGRVNLWRYRNWYSEEDSAGNLTVTEFLDPNDVVGYGPAIDGLAMFGAILDADAGLAQQTIFPKMWKNNDPSIIYTMSQSAPLFVPTNPNNTFKMTVIT